jgi:peptidoglycan/LPS O-acetylase OafA/YrhL
MNLCDEKQKWPPIRRPALPALTGARFFAALGVLLTHWNGLYPTNSWLTPIIESGGAGVPFFFVLSGFILVWNYETGISLSAIHRAATLDYLRRRMARLYPLYAGSLLAFALLLGITNGRASLDACPSGHEYWLALAVNLLAVQAWVASTAYQQCFNAPGWSVSAELFFYILLPVVLPLMRRVARPRLLMGAVLMFGLCSTIASAWWIDAQGLNNSVLHIGMTLRWPLLNCWTFLFGASMALVYIREPYRLRFDHLTQLTLLTIGLLIGSIYGIKYGLDQTTFIGWLLHTYAPYFGFTPFFGMLIYLLAHTDNRLSIPLKHRLLVFLGNSSYALYIVHWNVLVWFRFYYLDASPSDLSILVALLGSVLLACVVHQWIEQPIYRMMTR